MNNEETEREREREREKRRIRWVEENERPIASSRRRKLEDYHLSLPFSRSLPFSPLSFSYFLTLSLSFSFSLPSRAPVFVYLVNAPPRPIEVQRASWRQSRVPGGPRWRGEIIHHYLWRPRKPHGDQPDQQLAAASGGGLAGRLPRGGGRKRGTPGPGQTKETTQEYPPKPILHFPPLARPENVR